MTGSMPDLNIATHSATPTSDRDLPAPRGAKRSGEQHANEADRDEQRDDREVLGVGRRDHQQRAQVVDDGERQQEHAQARRRRAA